jgi:putative DNA primase/helicase
MIYPSAIPLELRQRPQWVLWKYENRNGKPTKVPYAVNGDYAKVNEPSTWATFDEALATGQGVGFVFTPEDPYTGIDLDHVRDPETGLVSPEAWDIVRALDSYTEWSVSGTGLHILDLQEGRCDTTLFVPLQRPQGFPFFLSALALLR